jgi:hypothetical protein
MNVITALARELAEAAQEEDGISIAILDQMANAINQGQFTEAEKLEAEFRQRPQPSRHLYRPGEVEYWRCVSQFYQGKLTDHEWQTAYDLTQRHRIVFVQYQFLALRAEWDLAQDHPQRALASIEQALQITKKMGTPRPGYHDLRAWALSRLDRTVDALAELQEGEQRLFAAETYLVLNDQVKARECALNAYRRAWCEGPPYIDWYNLERSRALLNQLGEPEPQLPPFDPSKVPPIPYEKEIREAIARLKAERANEEEEN